MIDFKDEIQKYKPVLGSEEVDKTINSAMNLDEMKDILDLLQEIANQAKSSKEKI